MSFSSFWSATILGGEEFLNMRSFVAIAPQDDEPVTTSFWSATILGGEESLNMRSFVAIAPQDDDR